LVRRELVVTAAQHDPGIDRSDINLSYNARLDRLYNNNGPQVIPNRPSRSSTSEEQAMQWRRKCSPFVCLPCLAASLVLAAPAQASEYGFGVYGLGYGIPMSGYTPPPGVYFSDTFYLYSGSAGANVNFPFGRLTAIGVTANLITNIAAVAWYTDIKILGGTLGFAAAIPYGSDTNSAAVSFIGPLGFNRQLGGSYWRHRL
jgi:hypothetical protein